MLLVKKTSISFIFLLLYISCWAVPAPAPVQMPPFIDATAISDWAKKSLPGERLALYRAYLASGQINQKTTMILGVFLESDLLTMPSADRLALGQQIISVTQKVPGLRSSDGQNFNHFQTWLQILALSPDTAVLYWQSLPLDHPGIGYSFDEINLSGNRASVLLSLLPDKLPRLAASTRTAIMKEAMTWPAFLQQPKADVLSMKKVLFTLWQGSPELFDALVATSDPSDYKFWRQFSIANVAKTNPTAAEWQSVLLHAVNNRSLQRLNQMEDNGWWQPVLVDHVKLNDWIPTLKQLANDRDVRTRAFARMILVMTAGESDNVEPWIPTPADIVQATDDWTAWALFWTAHAKKIDLSGNDVLACLDSKRPMLMGSVLDVQNAVRSQKGSVVENKLTKGENPPNQNLDVSTNELLKKCIAVKDNSLARLVLPSLQTIMDLGGSSYIKQIIYLYSSPFPQVRYLVGQSMLTFADTSMYQAFAAHLFDSEESVRLIAVKGVGILRDSRAVDALAQILNNTAESNSLRLEAAVSLGRIGDRRTVQVFMTLLALPAAGHCYDTNIRMFAAQELGILREASAVDALLKNIDPQKSSKLNYYCIEAIGKINDKVGLERLANIFQKAYSYWKETDEMNSTDNNIVCANLALLLYQSDTLTTWYQILCSELPTYYDQSTYLMSWYVCRNLKKPPEEMVTYVETWRPKFFENEPYNLAVMLEKSWDLPTATWLAVHPRLDWDSCTLTWLLSGLCHINDLSFQPIVSALKDSSDTSVRRWTANLAANLADKLATSDLETVKAQGQDLQAIVETWLTSEKDSAVKSWLSTAQHSLKKFSPPLTTA